MIRYLYNRQSKPPAPFVHVSVTCPATGQTRDLLPAQVDTGADQTVIPLDILEQMNLVQLDTLSVAGLGGKAQQVPTFVVQLTLRQFRPLTVEVLSVRGEPYILLGRDVLNHYRILLDGPQLALDIG